MSSTGPRRRTSDLFEGEHHRNLPSGVTMIGVIAELLDQLAHAPSLPGAACRGRPELFDVERDDRDAIAARESSLRDLPGTRPCRRWLASLPRSAHPSGVVAGRVLGPPPLPPERMPRRTGLNGGRDERSQYENGHVWRITGCASCVRQQFSTRQNAFRQCRRPR